MFERLPIVHARYTIAAIRLTPSTVPTAIPAFAPAERLEPACEAALGAVEEDAALATVAEVARVDVGVKVEEEIEVELDEELLADDEVDATCSDHVSYALLADDRRALEFLMRRPVLTKSES